MVIVIVLSTLFSPSLLRFGWNKAAIRFSGDGDDPSLMERLDAFVLSGRGSIPRFKRVSSLARITFLRSSFDLFWRSS